MADRRRRPVEAEAQPSGRTATNAREILDRAQRLQAPAVGRYVARLRRKYPDDSPAEIIARLERRYLNTVIAAGSAVGAAAAVPGVGTFTAMTAMTGETAVFLEASALLALSVAEVHGIHPEDIERRRALVLAVALGEEGILALGRVVGTRGGVLNRLASAGGTTNLARLNKTLLNRVTRRYLIRRSPLVLGKLLPAGVGAAIGGVGNRALGRRVIENAESAFGPPPTRWRHPVTVVDALPPDIEVTESTLPRRRRK